jgi:hypothetical protein
MNKDDITIVLVTSVIPDHPSTHLIDECIQSVRKHFEDNEIIMQIDGLREEQLHRKPDYDEYKNRILYRCLHEYKNILPIVFDKHSHQTTMMLETIDLIKTPMMLYIEADAPLCPERDVDWDSCIAMIENKKAKTIRFHFEETIPKEHNHLMLESEKGFMKTIQWSQRPHLTLVSYYKDIVLPSCPSNFFIEDIFHGKVQNDFNLDKSFGWEQHKLWIYYPNKGKNIKRSYHLDGRKGTRKFTSDDNVWGYKE